MYLYFAPLIIRVKAVICFVVDLLLILLLGFDLDCSSVFSLSYGRAGEKKLTVHVPLWRQAIDGTSSRLGIDSC